jgi:glycosyltransferase involved in cell wall biosynthesis
MAPQRALKILQVMRAPVGGLFRHVADLSTELSNRGHRVGLIVDTLSADAQTEAKLAALAPSLALGTHRITMPRLLGPADLALPFRIGRLADSFEADVLHGHGAKGGFHARLAMTRRPVRRFYTPHGGVLHFSSDGLSGRVFHALERSLAKRTDTLFFESHYAERTYGQLIGKPECHSEVVHNGLMPTEFEPVHLDADAHDFVFVGELRMLKGVGVLLKALKAITTAHRKPTLHITGDGPDRARFEAEVRELDLGGQVFFAGAGPAREAFRRGHVVVVPSLAESLPYIVMEAIAAGRAVIATDVGGIGEIYGPTRDQLVTAGDPAPLARAMAETLVHPSAAFSEARLRHVRQAFSVETMTDAIEAAYLNPGR